MMDIEAEKKLYPQWKTPRLEFKAIVDGSHGSDEGMDVGRRRRKIRPGNSWRR